jgi:hypothetical protein
VVGTGTNFQAGDVGKRISIEDGGTGGVIPFESVITVVTDTTHITLRDNVTSNTTDKKAIYGFNPPHSPYKKSKSVIFEGPEL